MIHKIFNFKALEIKSGKLKLAAHHGQVLLYSLLQTEKLIKSNSLDTLPSKLDDNDNNIQFSIKLNRIAMNLTR